MAWTKKQSVVNKVILDRTLLKEKFGQLLLLCFLVWSLR